MAYPEGVSLFNADGLGYGLFPVDLDILQAWDRLQPVEKGSALIIAYDNLLAGSVTDLMGYCRGLLDIAAREQDPLLLQLALGQLQFVYHSLLDDKQAAALMPRLEDRLWATLLAQPDSSRTKLVFRYFARLASSPPRVGQLHDIWRGKLAVDRLTLEEQDRIQLAELLAIRLPEKSRAIIARQLADIDNPDRRRRLEFVAPSLDADEMVRDAFFESLADAENRQTERWVSDAVANLHHPSRVAQSEKYLLPSLELLQEIQVTGDIFFPSDWLRASLGNHYSGAAAGTVRGFLAQRPDYNPQLRLKILQAADPLFKAAALRGAGREPVQ
jgi:aminopeptidase N